MFTAFCQRGRLPSPRRILAYSYAPWLIIQAVWLTSILGDQRFVLGLIAGLVGAILIWARVFRAGFPRLREAFDATSWSSLAPGLRAQGTSETWIRVALVGRLLLILGIAAQINVFIGGSHMLS